MTIRQMQIFKAVAETSSMRKASEELYLSPQEVSKLIKALEAELNCSLFIRSSVGVTLTETGRRAYVEICRLLASIDEFLDTFTEKKSASPAEESYTVNIRSTALLDNYASMVTRALSPAYPQVTVNEMVSSREELHALITARSEPEDDLICIPLKDGSEDLISKAIRRTCFCFCFGTEEIRLQIPKTSPYAEYTSIPFAELKNIPMLAFSTRPLLDDIIYDWIKSKGGTLDDIRIMSSFEKYQHQGKMTNRATFVSYPSNQLVPLPGVVTIPLEEPYLTNNLLLVRKNAFSRPYVRAFCDTLEQYFEMTRIF